MDCIDDTMYGKSSLLLNDSICITFLLAGLTGSNGEYWLTRNIDLMMKPVCVIVMANDITELRKRFETCILKDETPFSSLS